MAPRKRLEFDQYAADAYVLLVNQMARMTHVYPARSTCATVILSQNSRFGRTTRYSSKQVVAQGGADYVSSARRI
jgi:hypothetical protein